MIGEYLEKIFSLEGKTAIITGAAGGIGAELSKGLASSGANVALCDVNVEGLEKLQAEIGARAHAFAMDIADFDSLPDIVETISKINGRIDVLVNCAGINKREGIYDVEPETYDKLMDVNLKGLFFLTQAVAPYMKEQMGGSIINIGSMNTKYILGGVSVYGATKAAVASLSRSMAIEWGKYGIRANTIAPGNFRTELTRPTWEHPERSKYLLDRITLDRPGYPQDLVGLCIYLSSDASLYTTGAEFYIDGGYLSGGKPWQYDTQF